MTTANRQTGDEKADSSIVEPTDNVAMVTGQAKMVYDKLTAREWVAIIKMALIHAKPYLKYVPAFLPVGKGDINYFTMTRDNVRRVDHLGLRMFKTGIRLSKNPYIPMPLLSFNNNEKVVQVCEVSFPNEPEISGQIVLTDDGKMAIIKCLHEESDATGHSMLVAATMKDLLWLDSDEKMKECFSIYTQVGPTTLFVISYLLNETYRNKIDQLKNLGAAGTTVESFLGRLEFGNGITLEHPWRFNDGSKK